MSKQRKPLSSQHETPVAIERFKVEDRVTEFRYKGDPEFRTFCFSTRVSNMPEINVDESIDYIAYNRESTKRPLDVTRDLAKWVPTVPGVEFIRLYPYRVGIGISPAVKWEEIHAELLEGLCQIVYSKSVEEIEYLVATIDEQSGATEAQISSSAGTDPDEPPPAMR